MFILILILYYVSVSVILFFFICVSFYGSLVLQLRNIVGICVVRPIVGVIVASADTLSIADIAIGVFYIFCFFSCFIYILLFCYSYVFCI